MSTWVANIVPLLENPFWAAKYNSHRNVFLCAFALCWARTGFLWIYRLMLLSPASLFKWAAIWLMKKNMQMLSLMLMYTLKFSWCLNGCIHEKLIFKWVDHCVSFLACFHTLDHIRISVHFILIVAKYTRLKIPATIATITEPNDIHPNFPYKLFCN